MPQWLDKNNTGQTRCTQKWMNSQVPCFQIRCVHSNSLLFMLLLVLDRSRAFVKYLWLFPGLPSPPRLPHCSALGSLALFSLWASLVLVSPSYPWVQCSSWPSFLLLPGLPNPYGLPPCNAPSSLALLYYPCLPFPRPPAPRVAKLFLGFSVPPDLSSCSCLGSLVLWAFLLALPQGLRSSWYFFWLFPQLPGPHGLPSDFALGSLALPAPWVSPPRIGPCVKYLQGEHII